MAILEKEGFEMCSSIKGPAMGGRLWGAEWGLKDTRGWVWLGTLTACGEKPAQYGKCLETFMWRCLQWQYILFRAS
uniref:Uncharacterized protein n=1 Tax=Cucumis sativus TaxID=3659 RepID=A0A0A0KR21_CUCSA